MGYLIFRGVNTNSLDNVYVSEMPSHKKAEMRYTEYYVKGRDGALHVDEGLANFDVYATLVLIDGTSASRQIVNAWADGTGKLISSDEPGLAYNATVKDEIIWTRVRGNRTNGVQRFFDTARITFNCQPYMVEAVNSVHEFTQSGQLSNPGSATALPLIEVRGSGDAKFTINGTAITINAMSENVPVFIDCENGYVYTASGATSMVGEFPELGYGSSDVTLTSGVSKLIITPHWRWV